MFCGKCGKEIRKVTAYCPWCGNELEQESAKEKTDFIGDNGTEKEEQVMIKSDVPVSKKSYRKIAISICVLIGFVILGIGAFKAVTLFVTKSENVKVEKKLNGKEQTSSITRKENTKTQKNWNLFQEEESTFELTETEKMWVTTQLQEVFKGKNQAEWEEGLFSFHVLGQAQKQENKVLVDAVCCTHPIHFKEYVTQVQYIKLEFLSEQEPKLEEMQVRICDSGENLFTKAKASSECYPQRNNVSQKKELCYYQAKNVVDDDETTAWIEGDEKGYGEGEWISLSASNKQKICGIAIRNGFTKSDRTMERNAQVKKVTVTCSDGSSQVYELQKNIYESGVGEWYSDCIIFEQPIDTKKVTLTIESVYQGKRFYEYWNEDVEYYSQNSEKCKDTCISEIKVLTMPEDELYETVEMEAAQVHKNHYEDWQQAYMDALEQPESVIEQYNENMKLYVNEYEPVPYTDMTIEKRYDENGMLRLPNAGFLEDINGDLVPELFLVHAHERDENYNGNYGECVVHVFTFENEKNQRLYCGSFITR